MKLTKSELTTMVIEALGNASVEFMSNPLAGTEQEMPAEALIKIGNDLVNEIIDKNNRK